VIRIIGIQESGPCSHRAAGCECLEADQEVEVLVVQVADCDPVRVCFECLSDFAYWHSCILDYIDMFFLCGEAEGDTKGRGGE